MHTFKRLFPVFAAFCAMLLFRLLPMPASAAGETLTLSGEISGEYVVPDGVARIVLDGVTAADLNTWIKIPVSCEVVLQDHTENACGLYCVGDLHLIGGGALNGGAGIVATENLLLEPTGVVMLDGGNYIFTFYGDIIINSGTYRIQSDAPDAPFPILAMGGNIELNGGDIAVWSTDSCIVSMSGTITVGNPELNLSSPKDLMIADAFEQGQTDGAALEIQTNTERKDQYVAPGSLQRNESGVTHSETVGAPVIENGFSDVGKVMKLLPGAGENTPSADESSGEPSAEGGGIPPTVWIALGAAAVITAVLILRYRKKHPNHDRKQTR